MSVGPDRPEIVVACCAADDLVGKRSGLWLWCLPTLLFIVGCFGGVDLVPVNHMTQIYFRNKCGTYQRV